MSRAWGLALLVLVGCAQAKPSPFAYALARPLEPTVEPYITGKEFESWKIGFNGAKERVPGILTLPTHRSGKLPVLLILHGLHGTKHFTMPIAILGIESGFATLALDAPLHGERRVPGREILDDDLHKVHENFVDAVVDYRRALDYLATRDDVDTRRVVLLGTSMGGILGALVAAAEPRVVAAALLLAGGDLRLMAQLSTIKALVPLKHAIDALPRAEADQTLTDIDPLRWIGRIAPRPVLFTNGKSDTIIPKVCAEALIAAAKEPKTAIWENGGHTVTPATMAKVFEWLRQNTPRE